ADVNQPQSGARAQIALESQGPLRRSGIAEVALIGASKVLTARTRHGPPRRREHVREGDGKTAALRPLIEEGGNVARHRGHQSVVDRAVERHRLTADAAAT